MIYSYKYKRIKFEESQTRRINATIKAIHICARNFRRDFCVYIYFKFSD